MIFNVKFVPIFSLYDILFEFMTAYDQVMNWFPVGGKYIIILKKKGQTNFD